MKKKLVYICIAAVLFGLVSIVVYKVEFAAKKEESYKIVVMGDSVLGQVRDETSITSRLEQLLGVPVLNGSIGGSNMSKVDQSKRLSYTADGLSMVAFAQAICFDDFWVQKSVDITAYRNGTEYFEETIERLSNIDFKTVDILVMEHGTNDYNMSVPLRNEDDPWDVYTFEGALRTILETFQSRFPDLKIVLLTPTFSWLSRHQLSCAEWYNGVGYLEDYVNLEIQIAEEYGVEVVDVFHDFYPHTSWEDWEIYTQDGLHPNEKGREKIARRLAESLE